MISMASGGGARTTTPPALGYGGARARARARAGLFVLAAVLSFTTFVLVYSTRLLHLHLHLRPHLLFHFLPRQNPKASLVVSGHIPGYAFSPGLSYKTTGKNATV
jgi:hypothetical protein